MVVCGGWGVWGNENWLAACRVEDQLAPAGSRINFNQQRAPLAGFIMPSVVVSERYLWLIIN